VLDTLRQRARSLKRDAYALHLASRDPRTPWYAKVLAGLVLAYALSPIDLIPDFIPVLGYLDDLVIIPAGLLLVARLIPREVLTEARGRADVSMQLPSSHATAVVVVIIWLLAAVFIWLIVSKALNWP
jgi:uncharacterized membrane protein YkvA (DUF1232 family)